MSLDELSYSTAIFVELAPPMTSWSKTAITNLALSIAKSSEISYGDLQKFQHRKDGDRRRAQADSVNSTSESYHTKKERGKSSSKKKY